MADACHRAWTVTGESIWLVRVLRAAQWLLGSNDIALPLYDRDTGATFDGLGNGWVNENSGAESTLAGIATLQVAVATDANPGHVVSH
jgi:hypothetical protein